ncbi:hypothetical protein J3459_015370 [Metarhizium acridum]|nr:hypothetical protein J3459_015370 [Metarhizium acridum]
MMLSVYRTITTWYRPLLVALFNPSIPFHLRWRTLLLQPITLLTYSINALPYFFYRPFTVEYLPVFPSRAVRAIIFKHPGTGKGRSLRPLHVEIHGGSFIGGLAESNARFDERLAKETGAVVVSITYRFAPEHIFPCAIDDADATIKWIQDHAQSRRGADATLMTVSGFSCGGKNLVQSSRYILRWDMVETFVARDGFHGYLEVPDAAVKKEVKDEAFTRAVGFLKRTNLGLGVRLPAARP